MQDLPDWEIALPGRVVEDDLVSDVVSVLAGIDHLLYRQCFGSIEDLIELILAVANDFEGTNIHNMLPSSLAEFLDEMISNPLAERGDREERIDTKSRGND